MPGAETQTHLENFNRGKVRFLSSVSFLLGFLDAFFIYVISSYFARVGGEAHVGIFYSVAFAIVLVLFFNLQRFLRRFGSVRLLLFILLLLVMSAAFLSLRGPSWMGTVVLLFFLIMNNCLWVVLDILLEGFSSDSVSGRIRGLYLTIMNTGLLAAPFLSTVVLSHFGYGGVFLGLTMGYALVFLILLLGLRSAPPIRLSEASLPLTWKKVKSDSNLLRIYHVSFVLEFFYAMMIVYTPIYLLSLGLDWQELGLIFTIMLVPFVLLQFPLGILADRSFGEKEFLVGSLFLLALSTFFVAFIDSKSLLVWGVVLFLTRIGAASIEILRDSYFYKQIDGRESGAIALFRTARPTANVLGALMSVLFLLFFPLESIFFLVGVVVLSACLSALLLRDSVSEKEGELVI